MPTDIFVSLQRRRLARQKEAADLRAYLFLIPLIACLLSIVLCLESRAFEADLVFSNSVDLTDLGVP
jgi:hypothetical protein